MALEPTSPHFLLKESPRCGRGLFASQAIPVGTPLLSTSFVPLSLIKRQYRKEVCANCFAYETGRSLKIRDGGTNFSFCETPCNDQWTTDTPPLVAEAWSIVESFIKRKTSKAGQADATSPPAVERKPTPAEIDGAWHAVADTAHFILQARAGSTAKPHVRALQSVLTMMPQPDALCFLLSGVVVYHEGHRVPEEHHPWEYIQALTEDTAPYEGEFHLKSHVCSYLQLLALVPAPMLPSVTPAVCRIAMAQDSNNSFGIRSLEDDGSEFFGWGVWPEASFFNHSCRPNVGKRRVGRAWNFWAARDIECDEELLISYLGGDEDDLDQAGRRDRLSFWGFDCSCSRCLDDDLILDQAAF
jgi:SET and MYND domain-containing protein